MKSTSSRKKIYLLHAMDWSCEDWISCLPLVKLGILTFFEMLQIISLYLRQIFVIHYECQSQKLIIDGVKSHASKMDGPSCSPRSPGLTHRFGPRPQHSDNPKPPFHIQGPLDGQDPKSKVGLMYFEA